MVPVAQTIFSGPTSNCFQACVASVLELPLVDVPNFATSQETWFEDLTGFLKRWGMFAVLLDVYPGAPHPPGYCIPSFTSSASGRARTHTVVALDGEVVWDPNTANIERKWGLGTLKSWLVFCAVDPSKWVGK